MRDDAMITSISNLRRQIVKMYALVCECARHVIGLHSLHAGEVVL
jgi:hypothetical protein